MRKHGYRSGTGKQRTRFLEYRDRLLEKMISGSNIENDVGLEEIVESMDVNDEETTSHYAGG